MIDAHTHLENGDLSIEYVHKFIDAAKEKGITHLQILDHTHRFFEFKDCYKRVCEVSKLQEALDTKKDHVLSPDHFNKEFLKLESVSA